EDSPLNDRINYLLQTEINPSLASHGGEIKLIDVVEGGIAALQFGGGCQGCGMADVTLKEGVEMTLVARIPEITGVRDVTDHSVTDNAHYSVLNTGRALHALRRYSMYFSCGSITGWRMPSFSP